MNKIALVTGGSRGIGFGVAKSLASAGFNLAINGVRPEEAVIQTMGELKSSGVKVLYCRGDISRAEDRERILSSVKRQFGALHVLVNNAGVAPLVRNDVLETTEESFDRVLSINLKGPYFLCQAAANWMIDQKKADPAFSGCIINVSSVSAIVASVNRGEYCISKAGIAMTTQLFAVRLGEFDIPVFEVQPGIISTDMTAAVKEKYDKLLANGLTVQNRWGFPEDVGKAVAALASGSFQFSTGQVVMVDGGLTLRRM